MEYKGLITVEIPLPLGKKKLAKVTCKTEQLKIGNTLSCECPTPASTMPGKLTAVFPLQTKYMYFNYNSVELNKPYSEEALKEIRKLLNSGYLVRRISGFASPEGTFAPSPGFEGNDNLAKRRAAEACKILKRASNPLRMRNPIVCEAGALHTIKTVGKGELLSSNKDGKLLRDKQGKELAGKDLAKAAVGQFESSADEQKHLKVLNAEKREKLAKARTPEQKADLIYPLLRRAEILLWKPMQNIQMQIPMPPGREPCPPHVVKQAKQKLPKALP
jgi:hypothetical protein